MGCRCKRSRLSCSLGSFSWDKATWPPPSPIPRPPYRVRLPFLLRRFPTRSHERAYLSLARSSSLSFSRSLTLARSLRLDRPSRAPSPLGRRSFSLALTSRFTCIYTLTSPFREISLWPSWPASPSFFLPVFLSAPPASRPSTRALVQLRFSILPLSIEKERMRENQSRRVSKRESGGARLGHLGPSLFATACSPARSLAVRVADRETRTEKDRRGISRAEARDGEIQRAGC